ncbi:hypothetical protein HID58_061403, partial [Brassica napus]
FLTNMNTSRRYSYGVQSRCWCGKGVVVLYSRTDKNPYRRFYRCKIGSHFCSYFVVYENENKKNHT